MRTTFQEIMIGQVRLAGDDRLRPFLLDLSADVPGLLRPWSDVEAAVTARVRVDGWADDPSAAGTLRIAPVTARRIRYKLDFTTSDGRRMHLDGWKAVSFARPLRSMTRLPATVTDEKGDVAGEAQLRFDLWHSLGPMLASFRFRPEGRSPGPARAGGPAGDRPRSRGPARAGGPGGHRPRPPGPAGPGAYLASRWRGQPGRLEVWYTTLTDPATGTGFWLHHELVAPSDGSGPKAHGWAAIFPPDGPPAFARFGPVAWVAPEGEAVFEADGVRMTASTLRGSAAEIGWDLTADDGGPPLFTFPRWAWDREALPGAQIVPVPSATFRGSLRRGERLLTLDAAPGATARVYGRGNPERWAWLHADLGGGDLCEVVAATSTKPGLNRLPPFPLVRLRVDGVDWPRGDPLAHSARFVARIGLPTWTVLGVAGDRRIRIQVTQPAERTLAVRYTDPDRSTAVCRNSERADAVITLHRRTGHGWQAERQWRCDATAHAEVGARE
jgi:hypothetical protein